MTRAILVTVGLTTALVLLLVGASFYTVDPTEQVLVVQFGAPIQVVTDPGLHMKLPWVQTAEYIDKRLLKVEAPAEEVITLDKKRMVVDAFARWLIVDPLKFYETLITQEGAQSRLTPVLSSELRRVLGSQSFSTVLSSARANLMNDIRDDMNQSTGRFGIRVVDVRIRHADLPSQNSEAIYRRMKQERVREANEYRAEGEEISQRIRSRADREVTVLLAEAGRESQILRGEGDGEKTNILAAAYGQDADFFAFYRAMRAYQDALPGNNTTVVLTPDSEFFRYFSQTGAGAAPTKKK